jgi:hypothetical protein
MCRAVDDGVSLYRLPEDRPEPVGDLPVVNSRAHGLSASPTSPGRPSMKHIIRSVRARAPQPAIRAQSLSAADCEAHRPHTSSVASRPRCGSRTAVVYRWSTRRRNAGNLRLIVEQPKLLICRGSAVNLTLARPAFTFLFRTENRTVASSILALAILESPASAGFSRSQDPGGRVGGQWIGQRPGPSRRKWPRAAPSGSNQAGPPGSCGRALLG